MDAVSGNDPPQLLDVCCNHCGAPLSVAGDTRFATCAHCGSRLEIHQSGGAAYSPVLENIDQRTQRIERDVAEIKSSERIAQLDREWMVHRQSFLIRGQNGNESLPSGATGVIASVVISIFGIFWTITACSMGAPFFFPLFGVVFVCMGIYQAVNSVNKAEQYKQAERNYRLRRTQLMPRDDVE